jgi:glutamate racemase
MAHIGIFDTGFGGRYAGEQLAHLRPHDTFTIVDDKAHMPYGLRSEEEIIDLTNQAIQPLLSSCDLIVIACNTATTIAINRLREMYPGMPFVGFEPMIKTAATRTETNKIAILATPATLRSPRYRTLKQEWAEGMHVIEPDCSSWAAAIEAGTFDEDTAIKLAEELANDGVDVISLACTHYLYLRSAMQRAVDGRATVLSPINAVNAQIDYVLSDA